MLDSGGGDATGRVSTVEDDEPRWPWIDSFARGHGLADTAAAPAATCVPVGLPDDAAESCIFGRGVITVVPTRGVADVRGWRKAFASLLTGDPFERALDEAWAASVVGDMLL